MKFLRGLLAASYPFLVFAGLRWFEPRWVALLLGVVVVLRAMLTWQRPSANDLRQLAAPGLLVAGVIGLAFVFNNARALLFVPALVSGALFVAFARTLRTGPPLVETFARLHEGEISDTQVRYFRTVTVVWCVFLAANTAVCLGLAVAGDLSLWTLYTGLVSYLLIGAVFGVEFLVRSWRFRKYQGTLVEPLFRRLFPEDPST
jgi:uncharacterized membrane protein